MAKTLYLKIKSLEQKREQKKAKKKKKPLEPQICLLEVTLSHAILKSLECPTFNGFLFIH